MLTEDLFIPRRIEERICKLNNLQIKMNTRFPTNTKIQILITFNSIKRFVNGITLALPRYNVDYGIWEIFSKIDENEICHFPKTSCVFWDDVNEQWIY